MKTISREYRVDKTRIGVIKFIFEAHEGIAVATTLDPKTGHIRLSIAPDRMDSVCQIIEDLKKDFVFDAL